MIKRNLYLLNTSVEEALKRFNQAISHNYKTEKIPVTEALNRLTSKAVYAKCNSPLYNSAAMDGIAVVSANTNGASETSPKTLAPNEYNIVDTGDPIHPPFDAVIMAEDIQEDNEGYIIRCAAPVWQHIRPVGEDIVIGEMILPGHHVIRPIDIGVLLSGGITEISVLTLPTVAIIPTGTELIEPGGEITAGSIIESNSRMLEALVIQDGGKPTRFAPVPDDFDEIKNAINKASLAYDMVLVIAGTSAGREDYTICALKELGKIIVHGVAMKPGKPVILATIKHAPVIGIPGYPVSAYLAYENFAAPILKIKTHTTSNNNQMVEATLSRKIVSSLKHREYVRVRVGQVDNRLIASPLARGAGAAMSLVKADGFCIIDQNQEGLEAGKTVNILLSRKLKDLANTIVSIGSHDLILDIIADQLTTINPGVSLTSTHVGSMGGLMALKNGEAHITPFHLLDEETGEYNKPIIKNLFPNNMAIIKGVGRVQGIMVQKGNPLKIKTLEDLVKCNYINRQRGAGTRLLLDYKLKTLNIKPSDIKGYNKEAATHMAVAAAVKDGGVDAGMGILPAANAMGLDFIPIAEEEYDFAIPEKFLDLPHIKAFIQLLCSDVFCEKVKNIGGYTTNNLGVINAIT